MPYVKPKAVIAAQAARRDRLMRATLQTLARNGMPDGSWSIIDRVATRAKLSVGVVYKYFPNAREMIEQTIASITQRDLARIRLAHTPHTRGPEALAYALMVIYGLHPHHRLRSLLLAHPIWRETMQAELSELIDAAWPAISPRHAAIASAAALGAVQAVADVGQRSKNNALAATLFVLRGVGVTPARATAVMAEISKRRYSIEEKAP